MTMPDKNWAYIVWTMWYNTTVKDGCWLYNGTRTREYGIYIKKPIREYVHRISAHVFLNLDLSDKENQANHKQECPNRNCWCPDHLYVGTQKQNIDDLFKVGAKLENHISVARRAQTHCQRGHEFTPENTAWPGGRRRCRICMRVVGNRGIKNHRKRKKECQT